METPEGQQRKVGSYLTKREVADRYGVSLRTVKTWSALKKLPKPLDLRTPSGLLRKLWPVAQLRAFELKRFGRTFDSDLVHVLDGCLSLQDLTARYGVSKVTIHKRIRRGELPPPVRLGVGGVTWVHWPLEQLRDWERQKFGHAIDDPSPSEGAHEALLAAVRSAVS